MTFGTMIVPSRPATLPRVLAWLGIALWSTTAYASQDGSAAPRPNIIIFLADDLGYGDLGSFGSPVIQTPNLDRFADEGVRFTSLYASASNCSPSRAGLLTGRTPSRVGVYDIARRNSSVRLPAREITIAELLQSAGYDTFHAGKWHLTPHRGSRTLRAALAHGFDFTSRDPHARDVVGAFSKFLESRSDDSAPFFAYLSVMEPHEPLVEYMSAAFRKRYETPEAEEKARLVQNRGVDRRRAVWENRTAYFGAVSQIDDAFGELLRTLDDRGLRDSTFVFFTSDNGPEYRSVSSFGSAGPLRGAKGQVYEGGIRVPGILRYPGYATPGAVVDEPINGTDLLPTLCTLAGVEAPNDRTIDGVDFSPALEGEELRRAKPLYWSNWAAQGRVQYAMRDGDWKILAETNPLQRGVEVIDHIKTSRFVRYELYDLRNDVAESRDRSESEPEKFQKLKSKFVRLHQEVVSEGPRISMEDFRGKADAAFP